MSLVNPPMLFMGYIDFRSNFTLPIKTFIITSRKSQYPRSLSNLSVFIFIIGLVLPHGNVMITLRFTIVKLIET